MKPITTLEEYDREYGKVIAVADTIQLDLSDLGFKYFQPFNPPFWDAFQKIAKERNIFTSSSDRCKSEFGIMFTESELAMEFAKRSVIKELIEETDEMSIRYTLGDYPTDYYPNESSYGANNIFTLTGQRIDDKTKEELRKLWSKTNEEFENRSMESLRSLNQNGKLEGVITVYKQLDNLSRAAHGRGRKSEEGTLAEGELTKWVKEHYPQTNPKDLIRSFEENVYLRKEGDYLPGFAHMFPGTRHHRLNDFMNINK